MKGLRMSEEAAAAHQARIKGRTVDLGSGGEEKRGKAEQPRKASKASAPEVATLQPAGSRALRRRERGKAAGATRAPEPSEHASQVAVIQFWASYCRTKGLDERLLFCIPNASRLTDGGRVYKWAEGLRPGVPDLMLALPCRAFPGMFLEMKKRGNKPTEAQAGYHEILRRQGYNVVVAIGADEAVNALKVYVERAGGIVKSGALRDLTKDLTKDFPNPYAAGIRRV